MKAAVVRSFEAPPRYQDFDLPPTTGEDEVLAAGLHPRVKSGASGSHYADEHVSPMIPGIDAVGRLQDGKLVVERAGPQRTQSGLGTVDAAPALLWNAASTRRDGVLFRYAELRAGCTGTTGSSAAASVL